jgi:RNA-directed DNA polymerase
MVNGPEGLVLDLDAEGWDHIDWRAREREVRRLRGRIFTAAREQDWPRVRNLQKLLLKSRSNTLLSVRQATQHNAGRRTAGIDGEVALTSDARARVAVEVHATTGSWNPHAVRRVHIPKSGDRKKLRPLGIPTIMDRCHQARVRNALEPEWEARFEARSYGFRPGRGCHDAIEAVFNAVCRKDAKRVWILDADVAAAFDRIDHSWLMDTLGSFPAKEIIRRWLKAGVLETGRGFTATEEGTPQGAVISPLLLNVALHGMEEAAGVRYRTGTHAGQTVAGSPIVIRYAEDLIALCHSQGQAEQVKARLAGWLKPRGLVLNEDKTTVTHLAQGCDFLGFHVRRYPNGKLLIKPGGQAVRRLKRRLAAEMRTLRGSNAAAVVARLTPIIRGWAAYYRGVVSSRAFAALDHYMWTLTYKWATWNHANKPKRWIVDRYFGAFNPSRNDRWVFGDRDSGAYLPKFSWTPIVRHTPVIATASTDDPALAGYWAIRRRKTRPPLDRHTLHLLSRQEARCPLCGDPLLSVDHPPQSPHQWEQWWTHVARRTITSDHVERHGPADDGNPTRLVHASCYRGHAAGHRNPAQQPTHTAPRGLPEPCAVTSRPHGSEGRAP